ncbi:protein disulfide-isomerase precursor [Entomophthora muscae]|uniref:Protein disulfide-isomerase n=1 Tax=Entomophthora muscae TaxID=34485 RepID=A0ACC2U6A5_9FUNG|nr:protein disulfide-isomerase precursor [Entomophthora muscae]
MQITSKLAYSLLFALGFQSQVIELAEDTFDAAIAENRLLMTMFYVPWCSHCQRFSPEYEKASQLLSSSDIKIAKVNCEEHKDFCKSKGVTGYPTVKIYREGVASDYTSSREANAIVSLLKKAAISPLSFVDSIHFDHFIQYDKVVVMGFFDKDSDIFNTFHDIAIAHHDAYVFGHSMDKELAKKHGIPFPGVAVFKQYDEHLDIFPGQHTAEEITSFIHRSAQPSIEEMTPVNYQALLGAKQPLAYIFFTSDEERELYHSKLSKVARRAADQLKFVFVNSNLYGAHAQTVGLSLQFPTFSIQTFDPEANFPIDQSIPLTPEVILDHLKQFLDANKEFTFNLDHLDALEEPTTPEAAQESTESDEL